MSRCLVTGHEGYIGSRLYNRLKELGHDVLGVDIKSDERVDIRYNLNFLKFEPEYIFHMAAMPSVSWSVEHPSDTLSNNVLGASRILEFAKEVNAHRVIFSSSAAAHEGKSPYGIQKQMTELECKLYSELYGIDTVSLRYFNVYSEDQPYDGAYSTVISSWMQKVRNGEPLRFDGDGCQTRDFIHIKDIVELNIFCMKTLSNFNGEIYDAGTGIETSLNHLYTWLEEHGDIEWEQSLERIGDIKHSQADISRLSALGWKAEISINEGLKRCFQDLI